MSESPYLHTFNILEQVHRQIEVHTIEKIMLEIDYHTIKTLEYVLPNRKKFIQIDFKR